MNMNNDNNDNNDINYQVTGKNIPVPVQELTDFIKQKLEEYDLSGKNINAPDSPYVSPLFYHTKDGKLIKIPEKVQNEAISSWQGFKKDNISNKNRVIKTQISNGNKKINYVIIEKKNWFVFGILCLAVIFAIYFFWNIGNGESSSKSYKNPISDNMTDTVNNISENGANFMNNIFNTGTFNNTSPVNGFNSNDLSSDMRFFLTK